MILIIDDQENIRRLIERFLRRQGFEVVSAADSLAGLELLESYQSQINCLLLDVLMPGPHCEAVLRLIQDSWPQLPLILMSGFYKDDQLDQLIQKYGVGFLAKPFSLQELLDQLNYQLNPHQSGTVLR